ncbi:D-allose transport system permease protein AlsC [Aquimixticola soesokkakensis]|uniref:D-allose transport system permease protein AlsC n=1 Tax=Aquimixticola soesokkakensis TaxID=1519096 RepID=A0A1Y5TBE1_9RHOB|nr:ABC transporter permease [Aquimixticola soesokkakensis]SLN60246.1 D-allose transport system permease protein AlsC [Aquimixticola soesokkakensis]
MSVKPPMSHAKTGGPLGAAAPKAPLKTARPSSAVPRDVALLVFLRDRGILVLWAVLLIGFAIWNAPYFATANNAMLILSASSVTAVYAAAVAIGLFSGAFDLSLPGVGALASCVTAVALQNFGFAIPLALALGVVIGALCGFVNGWISLKGLNPLIVTIGTLSVTSGLAAKVVGGYSIYGLFQLEFMGSARYFGIPSHAFIVAALYIGLTVFLTQTRAGIRMRAVGGNAEAVRRAGLNERQYRMMGFVFSGTLAGIAGMMTMALVGEASPTASPGVIFTALTAVALAGVSLQGGRGSLPRVLIGALILGTIADGLTIAGVEPYWATVSTGALMIGALLLDKYLTEAISTRLVRISTLNVHDGVK